MDMLFIDVFTKIQEKARRHEFGEIHQHVHVVLRKANMGTVIWRLWLNNHSTPLEKREVAIAVWSAQLATTAAMISGRKISFFLPLLHNMTH